MKSFIGAGLLFSILLSSAFAQAKPYRFGIGLFQIDKEKNDLAYKPFADYLAKKLNRPVELKTYESSEALAISLGKNELDFAFMDPWAYVKVNSDHGAQLLATLIFDNKTEHFGLYVTNQETKLEKPVDILGKSFAFGDPGSAAGYLIPYNFFQKHFKMKKPEDLFSKVIYGGPQSVQISVAKRQFDAGAVNSHKRDLMLEQAQIKYIESKVIWSSDPIPNEAFVLNAELAKDKKFAKTLQDAVVGIKEEFKSNPYVLPKHYNGFQVTNDEFYKSIRDMGIAIGKIKPKDKADIQHQ